MEYDTHLIGQRIKEARKAKRYTQDYEMCIRDRFAPSLGGMKKEYAKAVLHLKEKKRIIQ